MQFAHRAVNLLMFLAFSLMAAVAMAQKPVKTDLLPYFDRVPAPPAAVSPGLKRPAGFAELEKQLGQLSTSIATARTPEQTSQNQAQQQFARQASAAGLENMTDQQRLAYLQQQGGAMPGYNPQAMQLAQQMQDPQFQAKLAKMSDAEKARFLQAQMAPAGSTQQRMAADPGVQAAQTEFMQQMQNPAFRASWEKKSEAEQDAYMQQLMRQHGLNEAKMQAIGGNQRPTKLAPLVASPALDAHGNMAEAVSAGLSGNAFTRVQQQLQSELEALKQEQQSHALPTAREGDCPGQRRHYEQSHQFLKRRLDLYGKFLPQLSTAWDTQKTQYKAQVAPFQTELAKIHYGDDIQRPEEKHALAVLAGGQQMMIGQVQQLASFSSAVYDLNNEYLDLKALYDQPFRCEEAVCFPATARVALPDGREVAIGQVRAGDVVLGYDPHTGRPVSTRVLRLDVHDQQAYPLVQLTIGTPAVYAGLTEQPARPTQAPLEVVLTPNHPVATAAGHLVRADELQPSEQVLRLTNTAVEVTHLADRQPAGTAPVVFNLRTESGNYFVEGLLVGTK